MAPIVEMMVETRLRWFEHVERRHLNSVVRVASRSDGWESKH